MPEDDSLDPFVRRIRAKLLPNYLPDGTPIERTDSKKTVTLEEICAKIANSPGFNGDYQSVYNHVKRFLAEIENQLNSPYSPDEKPVTFSHETLAKFGNTTKYVEMEFQGIADEPAYIDQFTDLEGGFVNSTFIAGNAFEIHGSNIKIEGGDSSCGVYFVSADDPAQKVKVTQIAENTPSMVNNNLYGSFIP